jgi:hypothetical protein
VQNGIRLCHSFATGAREAAQEFYATVAQPNMALAVFFCCSEYDLDVLGAEMRRLFGGVQVVGCTTAGEIGPRGYGERGIAGASFSADVCVAASGRVDGLQRFESSEGQSFCRRLWRELEGKAPQANPRNSFALLLIDGLSMREEPVSCAVQNALGEVPLVGGSAGDGMNFGRTYVFADGSFQSDSAALAVLTTPLPFKVFKTQHFVPTDRRLVTTEADTARRIVKEIDGLPAAERYARLVGAEANEVDATRFAASPVVVLIGGNTYVRSIQKANPDGSMTFFCAIEEGLVLRIARGVNLVENLERAFAEIRAEIGEPQVVVSFDCILRKLEIQQRGLAERVGRILERNRAIGFSTYGEQFRGVHVNQTLSGVAIGSTAREGQDV